MSDYFRCPPVDEYIKQMAKETFTDKASLESRLNDMDKLFGSKVFMLNKTATYVQIICRLKSCKFSHWMSYK